MKTIKVFLLLLSLSSVVIAQNDKQTLVNDINGLTASIASTPENTQYYVKRAQAIFTLNSIDPAQSLVQFKLHDALADINTAIALDGDNPHLYSVRAEFKRDINGDYGGAIEDMNTALQLAPDNADFYLQRANYQKLSKGCMDYRKCANIGDDRCKDIVKAACM